MALENQYRPFQNAIAFKRLANKCQIPEKSLAVGNDEKHRNIPVVVFADAYANMHNRVVQNNLKNSVEYMGLVGDGYVISENDLISDEMYLGVPAEVI